MEAIQKSNVEYLGCDVEFNLNACKDHQLNCNRRKWVPVQVVCLEITEQLSVDLHEKMVISFLKTFFTAQFVSKDSSANL